MTTPESPPASRQAVEALLQRVSSEYPSLSKQLQAIGRYIEEHRDRLGLDRVQDVAASCGVQPSAVVRFAKHFGFSGFSELQRVFREGLAQQIAPSHNYQARIREVIDHADGRLASADIAYEFVGGAIAGMQELQRELHNSPLNEAVELLVQAPTLWVLGARRSFPVAAYLAYALQHTDKPVQLVTGLGAMQEGQLRGLRQGDVVIGISFAPYAEETLQAAQLATSRGAKLIAITDSRMSPLAAEAAATLLVQESSTFGFRALTNVMALAQGLFIALAYRLELDYQPSTNSGANGSA